MRAARIPYNGVGGIHHGFQVQSEGRSLSRPLVHLGVSLGLAGLQLARTRRLAPALAPLLTGVLVDADHFVDYALQRVAPEPLGDRQVLPAHGWEVLPLFALAEARLLGRRTDHGLAIGLAAHLLLDQLTNEPTHPLTYSLIYRASKRFHGSFFSGKPESHAWRDTPVRRLWQWL